MAGFPFGLSQTPSLPFRPFRSTFRSFLEAARALEQDTGCSPWHAHYILSHPMGKQSGGGRFGEITH
ncbi:hypothetical protein ACS0TY_011044 [Phlomoides rotata]